MQERFSLIVPAAGEGKRLGKGISKAFVDMDGVPMVCRTLERFEGIRQITQRIVAVRSCDVELAEKHLARFGADVVEGGPHRQDSVKAALEAVKCPYVAVHDAARPFVGTGLIERVLRETVRHGAAIAVISVIDTIKRAREGIITETVPRDSLWAAQTPQAFETKLLRNALKHPKNAGKRVTDDAQLLETLEVPVWIVEGEAENLKITTAEDLDRAILHLKKNGPER